MMPIPNASEQGIKSAEHGIRSGHQGIYLPDLATAERASLRPCLRWWPEAAPEPVPGSVLITSAPAFALNNV
jgi:hypothetical protein